MRARLAWFLPLVALAAPALAEDPPVRVGTLSYRSGEVNFALQTGDDNTAPPTWDKAHVNQPVAQDMSLQTGPDARAQIRIGPDQIELSGNTTLHVLNLNQQTLEAAVHEGRVFLTLHKLGDGESVEFVVPNGSLYLLQPGDYDIKVGGEGEPARISVLAGKARIVGGAKDQEIEKGQEAELAGAFPGTVKTKPVTETIPAVTTGASIDLPPPVKGGPQSSESNGAVQLPPPGPGPAAGNPPAPGPGPAAGNQPAPGPGPAAGNPPAPGPGPAAGNQPVPGPGPAAGNQPAPGPGPAAGNPPAPGPGPAAGNPPAPGPGPAAGSQPAPGPGPAAGNQPPQEGGDGFLQWAASHPVNPGQRPPDNVSSQITGVDELVRYGQWQKEPDVGPVWFPDAKALPQDWAPYRYGHWESIAPWGWTWIDDQPWGFAPFHYGRWAQFDDRWGWVPGAADYAPALVSFIQSDDGTVGWVPLAPGEAYAPWYTASDGYRNGLNRFGGHGSGEHGQLANGRHGTVVQKDAFARGDAVGGSKMRLAPGRLAMRGEAPHMRPVVAHVGVGWRGAGRGEAAHNRAPGHETGRGEHRGAGEHRETGHGEHRETGHGAHRETGHGEHTKAHAVHMPAAHAHGGGQHKHK